MDTIEPKGNCEVVDTPGSKLHRGLRVPAKMVAGMVIRMMMMIRGWRFPAYFQLKDKWRVMTVGIEPDLLSFSSRVMAPGETVLDIGANIGVLSRHFCRCVGESGRVLSFEPEPENLQALRYNLKRYRQAYVIEYAISDSNEPATFYLNRISGTGNSLVPHQLGTRQIQVSCQTLDTFLGQHPDVRPDWVKIDVEGGEFQVLRGMRETVRLFPAIRLIIELCPQNLGGIESAEDLVAELLRLGFVLHWINLDGTTLPFLGVRMHHSAFEAQGYVNLYCVGNGTP
ncbi:MAG: FkbM family methyltransferase [bacterium]